MLWSQFLPILGEKWRFSKKNILPNLAFISYKNANFSPIFRG
jgi:hypothetical protein